MTKHTPGPWTVSAMLSASENHKGFRLIDNDGYLIGELSPRDSDGIEGLANAELAAAAPELFEALKLADAMLSGANMNTNVVEQKVRAAIAKVTGEAA